MKILILASIHDKPYGGHYHTARVYLEVLRAKFPRVDFLVIGNERARWISDIGASFIEYNGVNFLSAYRQAQEFFLDYDVLHAFDEFSFFFLRQAEARRKIYTRCGGPNPRRRYFPRVNSLMCISRENYDFFKNHKKVNNCEFIPNRVVPFSPDNRLSDQLRLKYRLSSISKTLLRISRIDRYYEKSLRQTAMLGRALSNAGIDVQTVIVGAVYDEDLAVELSSDYPELILVSDSEFTDDAKQILAIADVVVGTGRSLMEAASIAKIVLVPVEDDIYPQLLTIDNFNYFAALNFSERGKSSTPPEQKTAQLVSLLESEQGVNRQKNWLEKVALEHFILSDCPAKLIALYEQDDRASTVGDRIDRARHFIRLSSVFVRYSFRKRFENSARH